jgi:REP element-mobilizing transposase RayT
MSNHVHLVIKLSPDQVDDWTNTEVLKRWTSIFKGPLLVQKHQRGEILTKSEQHVVDEITQTYRQRLSNLGWFMKCLNEPIARMANKEDNCTGHFWEARYTSQALLTEEALLSSMAYVDLNPVRAAMAATPEESEHTSIKERIKPSLHLSASISDILKTHQLNHFDFLLKPLLAFDGNTTSKQQLGILFNIEDYLKLVDITGRSIRDDKRGAITLHLSPILERLGVDQKTWLNNSTSFEAIYHKRFARKRQRLKNIA